MRPPVSSPVSGVRVLTRGAACSAAACEVKVTRTVAAAAMTWRWPRAGWAVRWAWTAMTSSSEAHSTRKPCVPTQRIGRAGGVAAG